MVSGIVVETEENGSANASNASGNGNQNGGAGILHGTPTWRVMTPAVAGRPSPEIVLRNGLGLESGRLYRITLRGRCLESLRNPSELSDGLQYWRYPRVMGTAERIERISPSLRERAWEALFLFRHRVKNWIRLRLSGYPQLWGLVLATCFNEPQQLSKSIIDLFNDYGLQHAIALSASHVVVAAIMVRLIVQGFLIIWPRQVFGLGGLQLVLALVLTLFSLTSPSMARVASVALLHGLLKARRIHIDLSNQILLACILLVSVEPELMGRHGFWLSVMGVLSTVFVTGAHWFRLLSIPIIILPTLVFFFGRASTIAPISNICLGFIWEIFFIPLGFVIPLMPRFSLGTLESVLEKLTWLIALLPIGFEMKSVRLNAIETLALTGVLVFVIQSVWNRLNFVKSQRNAPA